MDSDVLDIDLRTFSKLLSRVPLLGGDSRDVRAVLLPLGFQGSAMAKCRAVESIKLSS